MRKEHIHQLRKPEAQLRLRDEMEACLRQALALAEEKLATREREILYLTARLDKLRRMKSGRSSKKCARQIAEPEAGLKAPEHDSDAHAGRVDAPAVPRLLRQTRTRKPFSGSLSREVNPLLPVEKTCPDCGGALKYLGEDGAEQLALLARVLTSKYAEHAPLYRQSEMYARQGVEPGVRCCRGGWMRAAA